MITTLKRDEMVREGRGAEMDGMIRTARNAQAEVLSEAPGWGRLLPVPPPPCAPARGLRWNPRE